MTEDQRGGGPEFDPMTTRDITAVVSLFVTMLASTKAEILLAMDRNSDRAMDRWRTHEREHAEAMSRIVKVEDTLREHIAAEEREDLIMDARIRPFRTLAQRSVLHWRDIVIALLALLAILGIGTDTLQRFI